MTGVTAAGQGRFYGLVIAATRCTEPDGEPAMTTTFKTRITSIFFAAALFVPFAASVLNQAAGIVG